jgi:hydrogenase maturation protease
VSRRLVIGVGNPDAGDDGAGIAVARRLSRRNDAAGIDTAVSTGEATAVMAAWTGFDDVVVVDACRGAGPPGSVHAFSTEDLDRYVAVAARRCGSTHGLGVTEAIGLARAVGALPCRVLILAIEGRAFGVGEALSPEVDRAAHEVVALLVRQSSAAGPDDGTAGNP